VRGWRVGVLAGWLGRVGWSPVGWSPLVPFGPLLVHPSAVGNLIFDPPEPICFDPPLQTQAQMERLASEKAGQQMRLERELSVARDEVARMRTQVGTRPFVAFFLFASPAPCSANSTLHPSQALNKEMYIP
jgi:hypothetical protein